MGSKSWLTWPHSMWVLVLLFLVLLRNAEIGGLYGNMLRRYFYKDILKPANSRLNEVLEGSRILNQHGP